MTHLHLWVQGRGQDQIGQFIIVQSCSVRCAFTARLHQLQQGYHLQQAKCININVLSKQIQINWTERKNKEKLAIHRWLFAFIVPIIYLSERLLG